MEPSPETDRRRRFEDLVAAAYDPLRRYLRRRTDADTAEEALGDTLLVLWRRFDDVPPDAQLPWCYAVARGCLANHLRGARRRLRLVGRLAVVADAAYRPGGSTDDPDLDGALAALPATDQEVLRLWAWEQLPPREIAVVLGITANAASIRLHRATKKLRDELAGRKDGGAPGHLPGRDETEVTR